ncbi:TetR/AcrR family transcriptional regulator [Hahella ganghwensis]|uniref:TetR/AcrR family transcriptional regulator n=1 Tax=Hahella ganghwensis TaxID=286420 RepID=UPI00036BBE5D|nr:TetR/AcrR family transcriptional regulator [Hahella ganghwensis]
MGVNAGPVTGQSRRRKDAAAEKSADNSKDSIRAHNERKILRAAELEFVRHGYKGTSMQAIADRAELPKANIHYYFKSKAMLYSRMLENITELWNSTLSEMSEHDDPAKVLTRYIRTKVELSMSHPDASKIYATEIIQGAPHLHDHLRKRTRQWMREKVKIIDSWISQGKMKPVDSTHLIFLIWSSTQHYADFNTQILTITNQLEFEQEDIDQITRFLCEVILGGCGLEPDFSVLTT